MNYEYTYPKKNFKKEDIEFMYVYFDNGDYVSLSGKEVVDIKINLYDKLVWHNDGICPVAESGYIKLKVKKTKNFIYNGSFVYNPKKYRIDRKSYIENRCVCEGGVKCVKLFDENNWHDTVLGNITAKKDNDNLILTFAYTPNFGESTATEHNIKMNCVSKNLIESIDLDFENCESFCVYKDEIIDMQLNFKNELEWSSYNLQRNLKSGFLKVKLDESVYYRKSYFLDDGKITLKRLERRLCGNRGEDFHDICHLYVDYAYAGFDSRQRECIEIDDIRTDEEIERLEKLEEQGEYYIQYISGYCKRLSDGSILIAFGENAEEFVKERC